MPRKTNWTEEDLRNAVKISKSYRSVILRLGLIPAGGNYEQVKMHIKRLKLDTSHFTGMGWNKGLTYRLKYKLPVTAHLRADNHIQSYKLKLKLFEAGLKSPKCELCGWCQQSEDGRIPVELDHINGDHYDNRIGNLRILCPNCHSLQSTHRGKNKKVNLRNLTK